MPFTQESLPEDILKELLEDNWVEFHETPLPEIIVANDPEDPISRFDLDKGDEIVILGDGEDVRYRGNVTYIDRIYTLTCFIYTKSSRQRLRDLYKVIRSICLMKKHNFPYWQFIRLRTYQEAVEETLNVWRGELKIQIENHAVLAETAV